MVEPEEGVYDWSLLTNTLARGRPVWLRFFASDVSHCPAWLQRKYPDLKKHRFRWPDGGYDDISGYLTGKTTTRSAGDFYEIWDPRFEAEFRRLLQAFAQAGFGRDPRIRFVYFPHAFRWNEYSLKWVPEMSKARSLSDYGAGKQNLRKALLDLGCHARVAALHAFPRQMAEIEILVLEFRREGERGEFHALSFQHEVAALGGHNGVPEYVGNADDLYIVAIAHASRRPGYWKQRSSVDG